MLKTFTTLSVAAALLSFSVVSAQSVGINTAQPGSTLDVNGSLAAQYTSVTSATYAMASGDFHISYNGTANAVFTLPAAVSGTGNFKGRMYTIKNNTAFTVTVSPAGTETINGNGSIAVGPNQSLQLISTGLTGAASTWEVSGNPSAVAANMTASNGLTTLGNDVRLGGTLSQNTAIDYADKALYFRSNTDGPGLTSISNTNAGTNASVLLRLTNNTGSSLDMSLNSSGKTTEGGPNAAAISNAIGPLNLKGSNSMGQLSIGYDGFSYNYNGGSWFSLDGTGNITTYGPGNYLNAKNGALTLGGNDFVSHLVLSQQRGADYYYNGANMLNIDGYGDISLNRPEVSETNGGNKIMATKGHLDLVGTISGTQTAQIYIGAQGFRYRYNGTTPVKISPTGYIETNDGINALGWITAPNLAYNSDRRLKTQIKEIGYGLKTIMALEPKEYEISDNNEIKDGRPVIDPTLKTQHRMGFMAQDLYKIIPEAVHKPEDDRKKAWGVDYPSLVPVLTKAIQEQQSEIIKLKAEIEAIKKKLGL